MKRLKRNSIQFDPIELFSAVSRDNDYKIEVDADIDDFLSKVGSSLKASLKNPNILHGKRIESLFAHVAGALGRCTMIKQEDSGSIFIDGVDIVVPDYSIILKDGSRFLVEVKNCHSASGSNYSLNSEYVEKLENYARLQGTTVKFAIYFSRTNNWVLLSREAFTKKGKKYITDFYNAFAKTEMAMLGDRLICAMPNLAIEFLASNNSPETLRKQHTTLTLAALKIYCAGKEITNLHDKNIAYYLIRFGRWVTDNPTANIENNILKSVRYEFQPQGIQSDDSGFKIIGEFSSMVSSAYKEHTVYKDKITSLDAKVDPDFFSTSIPDGYQGENLPLWQMAIKPNPNFKGLK